MVFRSAWSTSRGSNDKMTAEITINSYWGPRPEQPAEIGHRCSRLLNRLAMISPSFTDWSFVSRVPVPTSRNYDGPRGVADFLREQYQTIALDNLSADGLAELIKAGVCRDDNDAPVPASGYFFGAFTGSGRDTPCISLNVHAGNIYRGNYYLNSAQIETPPLDTGNRLTDALPTLTATMLALARSWDATWAAVCPKDLMALWPSPSDKKQPSFNMAWVTYLSQRFAPVVTPPRSAIVEYTREGGLVMTATRDRFDVTNPAHLAAAREIEAAMAPVNALPWPPDAIPER